MILTRPTSTIPAPTGTARWLAVAARILLATWLLFWTWFVCSNLAADGIAPEPVAALAIVWTLGFVAWYWPRFGSVCLLAFAAWAVWFFHNGAGATLVALPAVIVAGLFLLAASSDRARRAATLTAAGLCLISLPGCASEPLPPPALPFRQGSIERHADGSIAKGFLTEPLTIAGIPCRSWVRLQPDGRLGSYELAVTTTIQGHELPATTYVWLDDDGRLQRCFLARDTVLQGQVCRGGPFKTATSFHPNGFLQAFFPRADVTIDGVVCAASTQAPVWLHANARLAKCRLAADFTAAGRTWRRGEQVEFDANGRFVALEQ